MEILPGLVHLSGIGDETTVTAVVRDEGGQVIPVPVVWGSTDSRAVTVTSRGVVRSVGCGSAAITATAAGASATVDVVVPPVHSDPTRESFAASLGVDLASMTRRSDAWYVKDITVGSGAEVTAGRWATITMKVWLRDGTVVPMSDSATVAAGGNEMIPLISQTVLGMRVGGRRRVVAGSAVAPGYSMFVTRCPSSFVAEIDVVR